MSTEDNTKITDFCNSRNLLTIYHYRNVPKSEHLNESSNYRINLKIKWNVLLIENVTIYILYMCVFFFFLQFSFYLKKCRILIVLSSFYNEQNSKKNCKRINTHRLHINNNIRIVNTIFKQNEKYWNNMLFTLVLCNILYIFFHLYYGSIGYHIFYHIL